MERLGEAEDGVRQRGGEGFMATEDPEIEFLKSKEATIGCEWEMFKENVRPLKRGRNVNLLNEALRSHSQTHHLNPLFENRRKLVEAIDQYKGDDPLQPWLECIKWVQEAFPAGGDYSGLIIIYEQCVRTFWHEECYKNDLRYLKVWLEYAENCADAEVIYSFLDANKIGQTHSVYYTTYALYMEGKRKIKMADDLFNRGLCVNAQPREKLEVAYRRFLARSLRKHHAVADEDPADCHPIRSFGADLSRNENRRQTSLSNPCKKYLKGDGGQLVPLSIYKDQKNVCSSSCELDLSKVDPRPWNCLASHAERNKENNAIPAKWASIKIPQRLVHRTALSATASIEVFVDDDCSEGAQRADVEVQNPSYLLLKEGDVRDLKRNRESELLRENPLRNFPINSLPR
ncbi:hypothetical protein Dimus_023619 [Dionaea muscipula]